MSIIDVLIFFLFLSLLFSVGAYNNQPVTTLRSYAKSAVGLSNFALFTVIFGMLFGASSLFNTSEQGYNSGFAYFIFACADAIRILLCIFFIKKLYIYKNCLSVGDIIDRAYGSYGRLIVGVCSICFSISMIAIQFKAIYKTIEHLFDVNFNMAYLGYVLFCIHYMLFMKLRNLNIFKATMLFFVGPIVCYFLCEYDYKLVVYILIILFMLISSLDGVASLSLRSMLEFSMIVLFLPILFGEISSFHAPLKIIQKGLPDKAINSNIFNLNEVKDYLIIFASTALPILTPPVIQRVHLAKSSAQAKFIFLMVGISVFVFYHLITTCSLITSYINPQINTSSSFDSFLYLVDHVVQYPVLKGLVFCGIISVMFSTAEALINTATISFVQDVIKNKLICFESEEADVGHIKSTTFVIGLMSFILSGYIQDIWHLLIWGFSIWGSIVTVPLIAVLFNFKTSKVAFYSSVLSGIIVNILYYSQSFQLINIIGIVPISLVLNICTFSIANFIDSKFLVRQNSLE
jgi:SSS family solute:Na+ symporter